METKDTFAMIELMGHQQIVGRISQVVIAGKGFIRVGVMNADQTTAFTRDINPDSIYAINPISFEAALLHAKQVTQQPIVPYDISPMLLKQLAAKNSSFEDVDEVGETGEVF